MGTEIDGVNGIIKNTTSDGDITIKGNDGGSEVSALILDMSDAGTATFNHDIKLGTDQIAKFGDAANLQIYANNINSFITESGSSGNLKIQGQTIRLEKTTEEIMLRAVNDAQVELYYDNVIKVLTASTGINLPVDGDSIKFGANSEVVLTHVHDQGLKITHDGGGDPDLILANTASASDGNQLGSVFFNGQNSNGDEHTYAFMLAQARDVTDGEEDGQLVFYGNKGGSDKQFITYGANANGASPTHEVCINEGSEDINFRVESNGNANCLFVDAGENRVGVGTNAPADTMHIKSTGDPSGDIRLILETNATDGNCTIDFRNNASTYKGGILYDTDDNDLKFFTNGSNERMRIEGTGKIGINTTNTGTAMLKVYIPDSQYGFETVPAVDQTYYAAIFRNSSGNDVGRIESTSSSTSFVTSSDYRLKENVSYDFDATTRLKQLKPSRFNFINTPDTTVDGFLAHEVSSIVPEAISGEKDKTETYTDNDGQQQTRPVYQGIDQSKLVPLLVKTIQELEARITTLEG